MIVIRSSSYLSCELKILTEKSTASTDLRTRVIDSESEVPSRRARYVQYPSSPHKWSLSEIVTISNKDLASEVLHNSLRRQSDISSLNDDDTRWEEENMISSCSPVGINLIPSPLSSIVWPDGGPSGLSVPTLLYSLWECRDSRPSWGSGIGLSETCFRVDHITGLLNVEDLVLRDQHAMVIWTFSSRSSPEDFA